LDDDILEYVKLNGENIAVNNNKASFTVEKDGEYALEALAKDKAGNEQPLKWQFTYGKDFNWWWIVLIGGGVLLLVIIILLIIRRRSWKQ
jgi:hypothetical protein